MQKPKRVKKFGLKKFNRHQHDRKMAVKVGRYHGTSEVYKDYLVINAIKGCKAGDFRRLLGGWSVWCCIPCCLSHIRCLASFPSQSTGVLLTLGSSAQAYSVPSTGSPVLCWVYMCLLCLSLSWDCHCSPHGDGQRVLTHGCVGSSRDVESSCPTLGMGQTRRPGTCSPVVSSLHNAP